ncbi:hypothetical protein C8J57DRAFT_683871 [Mycena rebaudengoi]|nr:hypothetical protein C8J57DRAFT_683871 [Mycena rebaudengoi]
MAESLPSEPSTTKAEIDSPDGILIKTEEHRDAKLEFTLEAESKGDVVMREIKLDNDEEQPKARSASKVDIHMTNGEVPEPWPKSLKKDEETKPLMAANPLVQPGYTNPEITCIKENIEENKPNMKRGHTKPPGNSTSVLHEYSEMVDDTNPEPTASPDEPVLIKTEIQDAVLASYDSSEPKPAKRRRYIMDAVVVPSLASDRRQISVKNH